MTFSRRTMLKLTGAAALAALLPDALRHMQAQSIVPPVIIDGHLDLGGNMVNLKRDYTQSALTIRTIEGEHSLGGQAMIGLPELLAGRVAVCVGAMAVLPSGLYPRDAVPAQYSTAEEAEQWGWITLEAIEYLAANSLVFTLVRTLDDLEAVLMTWDTSASPEARQIGIVMGMEGADPIASPDDLPRWHARGLRLVGLAWRQTRYSGSQITDLGMALLNEMARLGMLLDVAHMSEKAIGQALDLWDGPLAYSHGVPQYFLPTDRGLSDAHILAIADRQGVVGVSPYNQFFALHRVANRATVDDVANAIDYVCQLTGGSMTAVIGSDADGGFGAEDASIDTVADLQDIFPLLVQRGYTQTDLDAIAHGNWLRVLRATLAAENAMTST